MHVIKKIIQKTQHDNNINLYIINIWKNVEQNKLEVT